MHKRVLTFLVVVAALVAPQSAAAADWNDPVGLVDIPQSQYGYEADQAVTPDGTTIAVWSQRYDTPTGYEWRLVAAERPRGESFGQPATIAALSTAATYGGVYKVDAASDAQGDVTVAWEAINSGGIDAARRTSAGHWGAVEDVATGQSYNWNLAVSPQGTALIPLWDDDRPAVMRRESDGTWTKETIGTAQFGIAQPGIMKLVAGPHGEFALGFGFQDNVYRTNYLWAATRSADGIWADSSNLRALAYGGSLYGPEIGIDQAGTTTVGWTENQSGPTWQVKLAHRGATDTAWDTEDLVLSGAGNDSGEGLSKLAIAPDGRATALMYGEKYEASVGRSQGYGTYARTRPSADGAWSAAESIAPEEGSIVDGAYDNAGGFTAILFFNYPVSGKTLGWTRWTAADGWTDPTELFDPSTDYSPETHVELDAGVGDDMNLLSQGYTTDGANTRLNAMWAGPAPADQGTGDGDGTTDTGGGSTDTGGSSGPQDSPGNTGGQAGNQTGGGNTTGGGAGAGETPRAPAVSVDTIRPGVMPKLVGKREDDARDLILRSGIHADWKITERRPKKLTGIDVGDVLAQSPAPGTKLTTDSRHPQLVNLEIYPGPKPKKGQKCPAKGLADDLKGADLALATDLLDGQNCDVDLDFKLMDKPDTGLIRITQGDKKTADTTFSCPKGLANQSIVLRFHESPNYLSLAADDWALTASSRTRNFLGVQVIQRGGPTGASFLKNAQVAFDVSDVGGDDPSVATSGDGGEVNTSFYAPKAGIVDVCAWATDKDGRTIYGSGQVRVVDRTKTVKDGRTFTTLGGRTIRRSGDEWGDVTPKSGPRPDRVVAAGLDFGSFVNWIKDLSGNAANGISSGVAGVINGAANAQAALYVALKNFQFGLGQISLGKPLSGDAKLIKVTPGSAVAAGGANVVASGGANAVAAGGANVIAPGGANAVAAGGANISQTIDAKKAVVRILDTHLISDNGLGLISDNGLGLISDNGLGLISDNGLGLMAPRGCSDHRAGRQQPVRVRERAGDRVDLRRRLGHRKLSRLRLSGLGARGCHLQRRPQ